MYLVYGILAYVLIVVALVFLGLKSDQRRRKKKEKRDAKRRPDHEKDRWPYR